MLDVVIALLPALAVSTWVFGFSVLLVTCTSVACCVVFEYLIQRFLLRGPLTVNNWSAVVTGMLLAFNLPSSIPLWMVAVGALVSIGVGKMTFGGLGKNPFNPALVGRVFMLLSFPVAMTTFPEVADAATGATPLSAMKGALASGMTVPEAMRMFSYQDLLVGFKSGSFGEVSAVALLLGFVSAYPVRGLDINSSYAIYHILNEQKKSGVGILFVGEDLDVMMALCDKIMVLCHGRVMGVVHAHKVTKEELGLMMTGALDLTRKYEDKPAGIARDTLIEEVDQ